MLVHNYLTTKQAEHVRLSERAGRKSASERVDVVCQSAKVIPKQIEQWGRLFSHRFCQQLHQQKPIHIPCNHFDDNPSFELSLGL